MVPSSTCHWLLMEVFLLDTFVSPWVSAAASSLLQRRGRHHQSSSPGFISRVFKDLRRERTRESPRGNAGSNYWRTSSSARTRRWRGYCKQSKATLQYLEQGAEQAPLEVESGMSVISSFGLLSTTGSHIPRTRFILRNFSKTVFLSHAIVAPSRSHTRISCFSSGVESRHRLTSSQLYISIYRELLSRALPGKATKQAPRVFTAMLRGLELIIVGNTSPIEFQDLCMVDMHAILGHSSTLRSQRTQSEGHQDPLLSVYCTPN